MYFINDTVCMSNTVRISTIYPLKWFLCILFMGLFFFKYKQVTAICDNKGIRV